MDFSSRQNLGYCSDCFDYNRYSREVLNSGVSFGTFHHPDGTGSQFGYFVPINSNYYMSPQLRKRSAINPIQPITRINQLSPVTFKMEIYWFSSFYLFSRGTLEQPDRSQRSTSYCGQPSLPTTVVPLQRTSLVTTTTPNVSQMINKFNQQQPPHPKLSTTSSVISTSSSNSTTTSSSNQPPTSSISSKVSNYSHTMPLPHKTKPQQSSISKNLDKIIQFTNGTLRRKTHDNIVFDPTTIVPPNDNPNPNPSSAVVKRDKNGLKYRHSCSHQDEYAIYSDTKKFGARKRKEKGRRRPYHSMNETIEVLADQVIEDDPLVSFCIFIKSFYREDDTVEILLFRKSFRFISFSN